MSFFFSKYHGLGNNFVLVKASEDEVESYRNLAPKVCDRNTGVGADGLILAIPKDDVDCKMIIFNADGSRPEMCGNGIRCLVHFLIDQELVSQKERLMIDTDNGVLECVAEVLDNELKSVTVDMGLPRFQKEVIPMSGSGDSLNQIYVSDGQNYNYSAVNMGNPHMVLIEHAAPANVAVLGKKMSEDPLFTEGCNVEFCKLDNSKIDVVVYERGCGLTQACGTGACAVAVAYAKAGHIKTGEEVEVVLPGGPLGITVADDYSKVYMKGPSELVFEGECFL